MSTETVVENKPDHYIFNQTTGELQAYYRCGAERRQGWGVMYVPLSRNVERKKGERGHELLPVSHLQPDPMKLLNTMQRNCDARIQDYRSEIKQAHSAMKPFTALSQRIIEAKEKLK